MPEQVVGLPPFPLQHMMTLKSYILPPLPRDGVYIARGLMLAVPNVPG